MYSKAAATLWLRKKIILKEAHMLPTRGCQTGAMAPNLASDTSFEHHQSSFLAPATACIRPVHILPKICILPPFMPLKMKF